MITSFFPLRRAYDDPKAEFREEQIQDDNRDGFNNLGGTNSFFLPNSTATLKVNGQTGNDRIFTGRGDDTVWAGSGDDTVDGGAGDDHLNGGSDDDTLYGGIGNDHLWGGSDDDQLWGGDGNDLLVGGTGNDKLYGDHDGGLTPGADILYGGTGRDILSGGARGDTMDGGTGADTFHYTAQVPAYNQSELNDRDTIRDFNRAEGDRFDFRELDANMLVGGDQGFFFATGPSARAGDLWVTGSGEDWTVFLNLDGGNPDMAIDVHLAGGATSLIASDFFL